MVRLQRFWPFRFRTAGTDAAPAPQKPGRVRRFLRDVRGVAALEFAMLGPPFFLILFSMFEVGLTYTADTLLQNAVNETARLIRTGEVNVNNTSREQFRQMVCDRINIILACDDHLKIDVREFTSFSGSGFTSPLTSGGTFRPDSDFRWQPGAPCSVVLVRAFYAWSPITPGLGDAMGNMRDGEQLLQATTAVRNEPFDRARPVCGT